MIRSPLPLLALAALAVAGCDNTSALAVTPELQDETSFESGLDGWVVDHTPGSAGTAVVTAGEASAGASYVQMTGAQDGDMVWLERVFTLEPSIDYSVTISADVRTFDGSGDLRILASSSDPDGGGFISEGPAPAAWERTLTPRAVTTDTQGRVWVAFGVVCMSAGCEIGVDQLGVAFVRTGEG